jgi:hypothetical protein
MTQDQASKLKLIGGGIVVLAAASVMLQPLMVYVAGLGRLIGFIVTMLLLAYLVTFVMRKMKGRYNNSADKPADVPVDVEVQNPNPVDYAAGNAPDDKNSEI